MFPASTRQLDASLFRAEAFAGALGLEHSGDQLRENQFGFCLERRPSVGSQEVGDVEAGVHETIDATSEVELLLNDGVQEIVRIA